MKQSSPILFVLLTTFSFNLVNAQTWEYELPNNNSLIRDIALTQNRDGDAYLYHRGSQTEEFIEFDESGNVLQSIPTNNPSITTPTKIKETPSGYLISYSPSIMMKTDFNGIVIWELELESAFSIPHAVQHRSFTFTENNGKIYCAGYDSLYIINELNGNIENQYEFGSTYASKTIYSVGSELILLMTEVDIFESQILRMDTSGNILSTISLNIDAEDMILTNLGYATVGNFDTSMIFEHIDTLGNIISSTVLGNGILSSIIEKDGNFIVSGHKASEVSLHRVNANGLIAWSKYFNPYFSYSKTRLIPTNNNDGYILATTTNIFKTDNDGNILSTSTFEQIDKTNHIKIFPNPASNQFSIDLINLPKQNYHIFLYDGLGRIIINQRHENYNITQVELFDIPKGIYYIKIINEASEVIGSKKLMVID